MPDAPQRRYFVMRRQDLWFIAFEGEEFGPYRTEREATLFAVDAAYKFGEQGEETQVLALDESGGSRLIWTYGIDHYPLSPE
jgi:hypothetical protein